MLDPTDHPDERQAYPRKLPLNPKIFSVATKVMLKRWDVCDRQVSGMQLLEKSMPDACSPHTYLFLQLNMRLGSLIPVQVLQYTTWWVCADIQPSNVGGNGGHSVCDGHVGKKAGLQKF